ncbi:hypothetical protein ACFZCK_14085 [Kitasatospora purpeofusca]|uniref:hypothetical protein n=1 Tax=Kitasatospora purpeofusca TaxID=67352 RepID=UPI0036DFC385
MHFHFELLRLGLLWIHHPMVIVGWKHAVGNVEVLAISASALYTDVAGLSPELGEFIGRDTCYLLSRVESLDDEFGGNVRVDWVYADFGRVLSEAQLKAEAELIAARFNKEGMAILVV